MSPGTTSDEGAAPDRGPTPGSHAAPFAERRRRLQALAGLTVRGSDGKTVGRVRDIYPLDAGTELAAITVMPRQLSAHAVLIPVAAIASLPELPEDATAAGPGRTRSARADDDRPRATTRTAATTGTAPAAADADPADTAIHLLVDAATAKAGAHPPLTLHATPEDLRAAATALGLGEGSVTV